MSLSSSNKSVGIKFSLIKARPFPGRTAHFRDIRARGGGSRLGRRHAPDDMDGVARTGEAPFTRVFPSVSTLSSVAERAFCSLLKPTLSVSLLRKK